MGPLRFFHVFPSFDAGGLEVRSLQLMGVMGPDVEHAVVALDSRTGALAKLPSNVRLELVRAPRSRHPMAMTMTMAEALRARRPNLVLTYNWGAIESIAAAKLMGVSQIVHHEDGFGPEESSEPLLRRIYIRRVLLPSVRAIVVPSKRLRQMALGVWQQPEARVHYLPNGVDLGHFLRAEPSGREREVVIGHVGRFRPEKNQRGLIELYASSEELRARARLLFVGDGPGLPEAKRAARELGVADRVDFAGNQRDAAPWYRRMDIFVLASTTEQMPLSVLEAMATGLPVVSTLVGDVADMLPEESRAHVVPLDRLDRLAASLTTLARDAALRAALGAANRAYVERHFPLDGCLDARVQLYLSLASRA